MWRVLTMSWLVWAPFCATAQGAPDQFKARRDSLMVMSGNRIILLPSQWEPKPLPQDGFRQDPTFYYFTGLESPIGAVLILDGPRGESTLFVTEDQVVAQIFKATITTGDSAAAALGLTRIRPTRDFVEFMDTRLVADSSIILSLEEPHALAPVEGLPSFADRKSGLQQVLRNRWPTRQFDDIGPAISAMRSVKSAEEIAALRRAGRAASAALLAGMRAIAPGKRQREVEIPIADACFRAGAQGVSWWPWAQTGPNAVFPHTFRSFADYTNLDRIMQAGEVARIDVGCSLDHYDSDVGRTAPVSGAWTAGQAEAWDLLIAAYRAGLNVIRDGVPIDSVRSSYERGVREAMSNLRTSIGLEAAEILLDRSKTPFWQIHGVGLEAAEAIGPVLKNGMVVAFEPMFTVRSLGFYLEDLLLITDTGYELLTPGLPYTAAEIIAAMKR